MELTTVHLNTIPAPGCSILKIHSLLQSHSQYWTPLHHLFLLHVQLEHILSILPLCSVDHFVFCFFSAVTCGSHPYTPIAGHLEFLTDLPGLFGLPSLFTPHSFLSISSF